LGAHRYERAPRAFRAGEGGRGIVYTTRAGFIDVGHVRITIDTVRYCADRVRSAMREQSGQVTLTTIEGSNFFVSLRHPVGWPSASPADAPSGKKGDTATYPLDEPGREEPEKGDTATYPLADEVAIRTGQRVAYLMMTWHEVITWFGWRTVPMFTEQHSSFTYDDAMSHVVGLRVAGRALRDRASGRTFDEAVTVALREELAELGAVSPEETELAARAVEGLWWSRGRPLKRQLDVGLSDDTVHPWLVPGLPFARDAAPQSFALPTLTQVNGHDFADFYSVRIDPNIPEAQRMRDLLPGRPLRFRADRDLPLLVEATRRQMRHQFAMDVDRP
ncbi:MAG: DUF4056 domain-containing protein, partial [Tepidisphaeraceae bacterium]